MLELTFEIRFKADYHVGAGYGRGFNIDSALLREDDVTPVLRGSSLAGLLRDGLRRLLKLPPLAKYSSDKKTLNETLARLFGSPEQSKRWRISSARPVDMRPGKTQASWRVRIDPHTRRAKSRNLFSQEEGCAGQAFCFTVTCPINDDAALDDAALLVAAARYVRQLGRSRRRGLGECVIHLTGVSGVDEIQKPVGISWEDWFLGYFDRVWMRGKPVEVKKLAVRSEVQTINTPGEDPVRFRVIVRLDEPLLIAERAAAGNQFATHSFIPGSTILGALAARAAENCNLAAPEIYSSFISLFLRGGVNFPVLYPAYLLNNNLYPTVPAPLGLLTCSVAPFRNNHEGHGVFPAWEHDMWWCPKCRIRGYDNRLEPIDEFMVLKKDLRVFVPRRSSEMHNRIDPDTQRVAKSDLFGYTVLTAGQYFVGEMLCAGEAAWHQLQKMTGAAEKKPLTWWLGKGRRRGYGKVTAWLERCDEHPQIWIQLPLEQRVSDPNQPVTLTLLTDTIIANSWGQQAAGLTQEVLEQVLKLGPLKVHDVFVRTRVVDGFNATLGLPRWRDTALQFGSTVRLSLTAPPEDWEMQMRRLEAGGIGLRRHEGFGRVAFNHPVYEQRQNIKESNIRLDKQMRLSKPRQDSFIDLWEGKLEQFLPQNKLDERFAALARWLYNQRSESPQDILAKLENIGQPDRDEDLKTLIDLLGGPEEFSQRSNYFQTDGEKYIKEIISVLKELQEEDEQNWCIGTERLAEWIDVLAKKKEGNAS